MRISGVVYNLAFLGMAAVLFSACKKENGIDNNTVIKKPYSLYAADVQGALINTNDGTNYTTVFQADGYPQRAIVTSGSNLIFIKQNVHFSNDNGLNFNMRYQNAAPPQLAPWQPMILNVPDHGRVYLASIDPANKGIVYSADSGFTWVTDNGWDAGVVGGGITSFTQLKNGTLYARSADSLYKRDNKTDSWTHIIPATQPTGVGYLSHFNNTLLFSDYTGAAGVIHSDDGINWTAYQGLPGRPILATAAPFDQVLLVGTDSMGIYRLQGGSFVPSNNGLETRTTVYAITGKDDIFMNEATKRYVYIATNKGIYRSEDLGQNWARVKEGDYRAIY